MKSKRDMVNLQSVIDGLMRQLEGKDHMIQHLLDKVDELESTIKEMSQNIEKMTGISKSTLIRAVRERKAASIG